MRAASGTIIAALAVALAAVLLIVGLAGGGQAGPSQGPFAWLRPDRPPTNWQVAHLPDGAELAYPRAWGPIASDPGTASVALLDGRRINAYLNATPKQGTETLANWSRSRLDHNRGEGNQDVRLLASASDLTFRGARGSCVIDRYTTSKASYREIACLVAGRRSSAVVVAAAPTELWDLHAPTLERAVASFVP